MFFNGSDWEYRRRHRASPGPRQLALEISRQPRSHRDRDHPLSGDPQGGKDGRDHPARDRTRRRPDHPLPGRAFDPGWPADKGTAEAGALAEDRRRGRAAVRQDRCPRDRGDRIVRRGHSALQDPGPEDPPGRRRRAGGSVRSSGSDEARTARASTWSSGRRGAFRRGRNRPGRPVSCPSVWAGGSSAWRRRRCRCSPSSSTNGAPSAARIRETFMMDSLYGGFWRRLVAYSIDKIILYCRALLFILLVAFGLGISPSDLRRGARDLLPRDEPHGVYRPSPCSST